MNVLLPPSEAKAPGGRGRPLAARPTSGPLSPARAQLMTALADLVRGDAEAATRALLLPVAARDASLRANAAVAGAPTMPALGRYRGVVYQGLGYDALTAAERRLASRSVFVFSGLFGVLRADEPIPLYRVPAKSVLPGIGPVATFWRSVLRTVMAQVLPAGPVLDLRSTDYAAMWRIPSDVAAHTITVRMLSPLPGGGTGVVSHPSKLAKGRLTALLLRRAAAGSAAATPDDVAQAWAEHTGAQVSVRDNHLDLHTA